jgi:hypothetical protein
VHPAAQSNGVAGRFIRTVEGNWLWVQHFATVPELIEAVRGFKRRYNEPWLIERGTSMNYDSGRMRLVSPDGRVVLECESSGIDVQAPDTEPGAAPDTGRR